MTTKKHGRGLFAFLITLTACLLLFVFPAAAADFPDAAANSAGTPIVSENTDDIEVTDETQTDADQETADDLSEPADQSEPTEPTDQSELSEPTEPADQSELSEPAEPADQSELSEPADPADQPALSEPAEPADQPALSEPADQSEPIAEPAITEDAESADLDESPGEVIPETTPSVSGEEPAPAAASTAASAPAAKNETPAAVVTDTSKAAATQTETPQTPVVLPLQNGTYIIVSKINGFKALQTEGASTAAGKQVELRDCDGSDTQKFKIVGDKATGYYTITNLLSGKILAVKGNSTASGTSVVQNTAAASALGQKWILVKKGDYYMFQSALDGTPMALTLKGGSIANGTDAVITEAKGAASQLFSLLVSKPSVTINSGVYQISPSTNSKVVFDISGGSIDDRANAQVFTANGTDNQKYIVTKIGIIRYSICTYKSGKSLDVTGGSTKSGANLQLFTRSGCPSQEFYIRNVGDGTLYITGVKSGLSVSLKGGKTTAGTNLQMETAKGTNAQKFTFKKVANSEISPVANGTYIIHSKAAQSLVFGVENGSRQMSANIQLQNNTSASFQKFKFTNLYNGYYTITNVKSKHNLEVQAGSYANKADVQQYKDTGGQAQQWLIRKNADGSFTFINAKTSRALDITGNSQKDSTQIQQYTRSTTTNAQRFTLTKSSGTDSKAIDYTKANVNSTISAMMKKAQNYSKGYGDYLILVNRGAHRVVTFEKQEGRWIMVRNSPCCVGKASTPTPTGTFEIYTRYYNFHGDYSDSYLTYTCYYALPFYGPYYFHTILYNYGTWTVRDGRMNKNISHGCVRMPTEEIKWLYDRYYDGVYGSKVVVYN